MRNRQVRAKKRGRHTCPIRSPASRYRRCAASVIAGCPRDLLTRLLAGVAERQDALSALAIEHETLKLCHERQLIVTGIFETEAQLRALRAPAEPADGKSIPDGGRHRSFGHAAIEHGRCKAAGALHGSSAIPRKPCRQRRVTAGSRSSGWRALCAPGVTDGRRGLVRARGRSAPRRRPDRPDRRAPARRANQRRSDDQCIALQGAGPETAHDQATAEAPVPAPLQKPCPRSFARLLARPSKHNGNAAPETPDANRLLRVPAMDVRFRRICAVFAGGRCLIARGYEADARLRSALLALRQRGAIPSGGCRRTRDPRRDRRMLAPGGGRIVAGGGRSGGPPDQTPVRGCRRGAGERRGVRDWRRRLPCLRHRQ